MECSRLPFASRIFSRSLCFSLSFSSMSRDTHSVGWISYEMVVWPKRIRSVLRASCDYTKKTHIDRIARWYRMWPCHVRHFLSGIQLTCHIPLADMGWQELFEQKARPYCTILLIRLCPKRMLMQEFTSKQWPRHNWKSIWSCACVWENVRRNGQTFLMWFKA